MQIGEVIRKYRKERNLTQEEMARYLGVTAPAVNKWENGNSCPDITLLAPIARLLGITLDTLLTFRKNLSEKEIADFVQEADRRFQTEAYEEVFCWIKDLIQTYPNCKQLIWQMAVILDAQRILQELPEPEKYEDFILECFTRVLESREEKLRTGAADSLFGFYLRKEEFEKAETYLAYFSEQNPERKRKQALIYSKTGRMEEAYRVYEEILFSGYQMMSMVFSNMYGLAVQTNRMDKAHYYIDKLEQLAKLFEMGKYYEASNRLELAVMEKDVDTVLKTVEIMLGNVEDLGDFTKNQLYEHMTFKKPGKDFIEKMREMLLKCFHDEETYDFLKDNKRWQELLG
ncbi:helix-turn-helix domain-containing protein [bacterium]|nr:helix-turn-helix domain-containing protein [bacterium]MDY3022167.1 helix-turn-helix transcriptional regulator [Oliverpabstia sp.]